MIDHSYSLWCPSWTQGAFPKEATHWVGIESELSPGLDYSLILNNLTMLCYLGLTLPTTSLPLCADYLLTPRGGQLLQRCMTSQFGLLNADKVNPISTPLQYRFEKFKIKQTCVSKVLGNMKKNDTQCHSQIKIR